MDIFAQLFKVHSIESLNMNKTIYYYEKRFHLASQTNAPGDLSVIIIRNSSRFYFSVEKKTTQEFKEKYAA